MAIYTLRANLATANFPFLSELEGRTIIIPGYDMNFDRTTASSADADKDKGIPQVYYLENCVPQTYGYQSVGYETLVPGLTGAQDFSTVVAIQTANFGRILLVPAGGKNYILDRTVSDTWNTNSEFPANTVPNDVLVTSAFIQGETYIYYANYGCFKYNTTTKLLEAVTLTSLVATDVLAIAASNGYMIAVTSSGVAWSSLVDPTDFTPNISTGASGGNLQEANGAIKSIYSLSSGVLVYCENNIVGGKVTSNVTFPFAWNSLPNSGGIERSDQVSWQQSLAAQYAWTSAGLQKVSAGSCQNYLPELTDFLASKVIEDFNSATNEIVSSTLTTAVSVAVHFIGQRWLVISYGANYPDFDYAIVYDQDLKRYGKLKIKHRDCFQWNFPNLYGPITYDMMSAISYDSLATTTYDDLATGMGTEDNVKESFAFLQADGTIKRVVFDLFKNVGEGLMLLGKFQLARNNFIQHNRTEIETVADSSNLQFYIVPSMNGKDMLPAVPGFLLNPTSSKKIKTYQKLVVGKNISLLLKGDFAASSIIIQSTPHGME